MNGATLLPDAGHSALALLSALGVGVGLWTLLLPQRDSSSRAPRASTPLERIAHHLRDISAEAREVLQPAATDPLSVGSVVLSPTFDAAARLFHRIAGGGDEALLDRAGWAGRHADYQALRLMATLAGVAGAVTIGVALMFVGVGIPVLSLIVVAGLGAIGGVGVFDHWIRTVARNREEQLSEEFPTVVELLALALSAGDSLHGALRRIAQRGSGQLANEWARVLRRVELGEPLGETLTESAHRMGNEDIEAMVDHLVQALERGAPLAEVVRAHSSDSRLRRLRAVVDRAGKAEVAMLVPLVLMILPITVIFAVWPSLQALQSGF